MRQDAALEVVVQRLLNKARHTAVFARLGQKVGQVLVQHAMQNRLLRVTRRIRGAWGPRCGSTRSRYGCGARHVACTDNRMPGRVGSVLADFSGILQAVRHPGAGACPATAPDPLKAACSNDSAERLLISIAM